MSAAPRDDDTRVALAAIAAAPPAEWPALVRARFDAATAAQALAWLHADRARTPLDDGAGAPALGGDRYRLGTRLGGGATAAVWQAYDTKLGRHVAIKIFARSSALAEVLAEARAACDVISDHVVRVLDVHDDDDPAYLVMELVGEHDPHRSELVAGASAAVTRPRGVDEAVRWVRDVARGVHAAHLRDVFHRDVKPANVMITPVSRRARVADFGLAVSAGNTSRVRVAGTPEFMAPELARGLALAIDPFGPRGADERARLVAVDVWGVGALAYALCADHPPWRATAAHDAWEIAAGGARPAPLSKRIPARLRRVIARAMAPDGASRYASAGELAAELDAYLARRPTSLDRGRRPLRAWLWSRRNPQLAITALVAIALAIGTLATYLTVVRLRDERAALRVEMAAQVADRDALEARAAKTRKTLATTTDDLQRQSGALVSLQRALAEGEREYQAIIEAKERALRDAGAATRALVDQLAAAHADRDAAQFGRALYQGYWDGARSDADHAAKERDQAVAARAAAEKERDAALAARAAVEAQLKDLEARVDQAHTEASALAPTSDAGADANAPADADIRVTDGPPRHTPDLEGRE